MEDFQAVFAAEKYLGRANDSDSAEKFNAVIRRRSGSGKN